MTWTGESLKSFKFKFMIHDNFDSADHNEVKIKWINFTSYNKREIQGFVLAGNL